MPRSLSLSKRRAAVRDDATRRSAQPSPNLSLSVRGKLNGACSGIWNRRWISGCHSDPSTMKFHTPSLAESPAGNSTYKNHPGQARRPCPILAVGRSKHCLFLSFAVAVGRIEGRWLFKMILAQSSPEIRHLAAIVTVQLQKPSGAGQETLPHLRAQSQIVLWTGHDSLFIIKIRYRLIEGV